MSEKRSWSILGMFALMYISNVGAYLDALIEINSGLAFLYALIDLLIISVFMMAIPFVIWLIRRKKFTYKIGKIICICNSIGVFLIMNIIAIEFNLGSVGGIGAIFYYFINKWLFVEEKSDTQELS